MSAYAGDTLLYRNRVFRLGVRPLEGWFRLIGHRPLFRRPSYVSPALQDYSATWEIDAGGMLQLVGLTGCWADAAPLALGHLFPFCEESVAATWYSGCLRGSRAGPSRFAQMQTMASDGHTATARDGGSGAGLASVVLVDLALEIRAGRLLDADGCPVSDAPVRDATPAWTTMLV